MMFIIEPILKKSNDASFSQDEQLILQGMHLHFKIILFE